MSSPVFPEYRVVYSHGASAELTAELRGHRVLIATDEALWSKYGRLFGGLDARLVYTRTMEEAELRAEFQSLAPFDAAIGLGGGMALDIAKYHAWKAEKPLYQVPTAISMDAMFSYPIALRIDGKVQYTGEKFPDAIYCDFDILAQAPPLLNRSGICDLLSCHTALFDWKLACDTGHGRMDPGLFAGTQEILAEVKDRVDDIYRTEPGALRMLMEGYKFVAVENYRVKHCQYEEGSEHFFYYCLEALTGRRFLHGQVINLGILLMSLLQDNDVPGIVEILKRCGVPVHPASMGIGYGDIRQALRQCNRYVAEKGYSYSILNHRAITEEFIDRAIARLQQEFDPEYSG